MIEIELESSLRNRLLDALAVRRIAGRAGASLALVDETADLIRRSPGVLLAGAETVHQALQVTTLVDPRRSRVPRVRNSTPLDNARAASITNVCLFFILFTTHTCQKLQKTTGNARGKEKTYVAYDDGIDKNAPEVFLRNSRARDENPKSTSQAAHEIFFYSRELSVRFETQR